MNVRRIVALAVGLLALGRAAADSGYIPTPAMPAAMPAVPVMPPCPVPPGPIVAPPFPVGLPIPPCPDCRPDASTGAKAAKKDASKGEPTGPTVCVQKVEVKKVTHPVYGVKVVEYCLPSHCGDGCSEVRTKNVLVKKMVTEEKLETKCVVQAVGAPKTPKEPTCEPPPCPCPPAIALPPGFPGGGL